MIVINYALRMNLIYRNSSIFVTPITPSTKKAAPKMRSFFIYDTDFIDVVLRA